MTGAEKQRRYRERLKVQEFMASFEVCYFLGFIREARMERTLAWLHASIEEWGVDLTRRSVVLLTPYVAAAEAAVTQNSLPEKK